MKNKCLFSSFVIYKAPKSLENLVFITLAMPTLIAHADAKELAVLIQVWLFIYTHTLCVQAANDLTSLHIYTGPADPSFLDTAVSASTTIKCAGSFNLFFVLQAFNLYSLI